MKPPPFIPPPVYVLLVRNNPVATQLAPFTIPSYGSTMKVEQHKYVLAPTEPPPVPGKPTLPKFLYDMDKWLCYAKFESPEDEVTCLHYSNQLLALLRAHNPC